MDYFCIPRAVVIAVIIVVVVDRIGIAILLETGISLVYSFNQFENVGQSRSITIVVIVVLWLR